MLVIDDDPFIDLPGVKGVRLASLDQFRRVVQIGTFSKILSPSLRSGYIIAAPEIASSLAELKMILTVSSSSLTERIIAEFIRSRRYEKHRQSLFRRLERERGAVTDRLHQLGLNTTAVSHNGLYSWLSLPQNLDDLKIAQQAASQGIFLAPGKLFRAGDEPHKPALRLNWSRANDSRFFAFLRGVLNDT